MKHAGAAALDQLESLLAGTEFDRFRVESDREQSYFLSRVASQLAR
ncbi:MAG: hypothetical protein Q7U20_01760 [Caulobacter sp.]|nr:hypothetical protein [Caulobacter sp.]